MLSYLYIGECVEKWQGSNTRYRHYSKHNNRGDCEAEDGQWLEFSNYLERTTIATEALCNAENAKPTNQENNIRYIWARPMRVDGSVIITKECLVALNAPDCMEAPFGRDNHLGNGADLEAMRYDWILPHFPSGRRHRVVLRLRFTLF